MALVCVVLAEYFARIDTMYTTKIQTAASSSVDCLSHQHWPRLAHGLSDCYLYINSNNSKMNICFLSVLWTFVSEIQITCSELLQQENYINRGSNIDSDREPHIVNWASKILFELLSELFSFCSIALNHTEEKTEQQVFSQCWNRVMQFPTTISQVFVSGKRWLSPYILYHVVT